MLNRDHMSLKTLEEAYIVDSVRTPIGKRNGSLRDVHPVDLEKKGKHRTKIIIYFTIPVSRARVVELGQRRQIEGLVP